MTREKLEDVINGGKALCSYCQSDCCEWCKVERLVEDARSKLDAGDYSEDEDEYYIRSSTYGDYSPSNPAGAPGMSWSDFIR